MGNLYLSAPSENNDNNSELNQNERDYINHIFRNNGFTPLESQTQIIKEKTKRTKAYESPIMIKRTDIKLEKDSIGKFIYYISFKYTSLYNFDVKIYFNATENFDKKNEDDFISSDAKEVILAVISDLESYKCLFSVTSTLSVHKYDAVKPLSNESK